MYSNSNKISKLVMRILKKKKNESLTAKNLTAIKPELLYLELCRHSLLTKSS